MRATRSLWDRFHAKIEPEPMSGCWLWSGSISSRGYGKIRQYVNGTWKNTRAHRVAFELYHGRPSDDALVCHKCDVPLCVNPAHLWIGTQSDNIRDCYAKGRAVDLSGENHPQAKLTEGEVLAIRSACRAGEARNVIATRYGISPRTVADIESRHSWGHL